MSSLRGAVTNTAVRFPLRGEQPALGVLVVKGAFNTTSRNTLRGGAFASIGTNEFGLHFCIS